MDIKLPLVVVHRGRRLIEAWVPGLDPVRAVGPSLSEMRDDLALKVMELFEFATPARFGAYQLPPHVSLRMVDIDVVAQDRAKKKRVPLEGRLGVLLEKWPDDTFYVVTPTRIPSARFALRSPDDLESALNRRIAAWVLENNVESLAPWSSDRRERLDILEVDADAPSIFPKGPKRYLRRPKKKKSASQPQRETEREKDERRRMRRLSVQTLRTIARNLSHGARDDSLDRAFGREALVKTLVDDFDLREGNAVVLVGEPGSGKTAIVHEFVRRLSERYQSHDLRRDVWRVDGNRFIAGMMYVGQWEERARSLIDELIDLGDVLYIDDLASMVYAGRTSKQDTHVAQFLEPHLARGELTVLAESTPERFERVREEAPTFASLFRVVRVDSLSDRETLPVLLGVLRDLESDAEGYVTPVRVTPDALETVLALTRRFLAHEAYPGKAVRLVRSVLSTPGTVRDGYRWYEARDVFDAFKRLTGLPDFILGAEPPRTRESIRASLGAMVAGQPEAIEAVTDVVVTMQRSLSDPEKPLATYLFVGPTGVGKTETARALATYLFGSPSRMVRFDMSEFASSVSVTRLVGHAGSPDGELTLALRTQPFTVVLFDEIEKAHPRVFDALLQLFGEGRLTDAAGRLVDFRGTIIVMTSNLGATDRQRASFTRESAADFRRAVRDHFRPEMQNRIDYVVEFRSLSLDDVVRIVDLELEKVQARTGLVRRGIRLVASESARRRLATLGYEPSRGARPLRRVIEELVVVPIATALAADPARRGGEVRIEVEGDGPVVLLNSKGEAIQRFVNTKDPKTKPQKTSFTLDGKLLVVEYANRTLYLPLDPDDILRRADAAGVRRLSQAECKLYNVDCQ
jgi:ATP-dependent Clp protease ATP-binding subunit ClpC